MTKGALVPSMIAALIVVAVCMVTGGTVHPGGLAGPLLITAGAVVSMTAGLLAWRLYCHARLSHHLRLLARPMTLQGFDVQIIDDLDGAFVAGLHDPRIYCGADLGDRLDPDELRAVLNHERFHQLERAPAKLAGLQAIWPLLRFFPAGKAWVARCEADLEIAADRYALARGASRQSLSMALMKLSRSLPTVGPGFTSAAAELRVRALLDPDRPTPPAHGWLVTLPLVAVVCVVLMF